MLSVLGLAIGALALGFSFTFALPAQSVTVPSLVPQAETKRALALDGVSYNLGRALAPVFSVALFLTAGFSWVFAVNAVSFGFFAAVLLRLSRPERLSWPTAGTDADQRPAGNGFRIAWQDRRPDLCSHCPGCCPQSSWSSGPPWANDSLATRA